MLSLIIILYESLKNFNNHINNKIFFRFESMKKLLVLFSACSFVLTSCAQNNSIVGAGKKVDPYHFTSTKTLTCTHGAVASAHPLASEIGLAIMQRGGNAF